jgi:hypothetical protein
VQASTVCGQRRVARLSSAGGGVGQIDALGDGRAEAGAGVEVVDAGQGVDGG